MGRRLVLLLLGVCLCGCGRTETPAPPAGVEIGPAEPMPWAPTRGGTGTVYRMVDRADQLRVVLPRHNLPVDGAGEPLAPVRIDDHLDLDQLEFSPHPAGESGELTRWAAPFPPPSFPRLSGRWIVTADHASLLAVDVGGEPLAHDGEDSQPRAGTWGWGGGQLWLTLVTGAALPAGTVRLRHDHLGHEAWHAHLREEADIRFVVRSVDLPARELDRSKPQLTPFEPLDRREALYVPSPGAVSDVLEIPAAARLELACGLVLWPTFDLGPGVSFSGRFVDAADGREHELFHLELDPGRVEDRGWHDLSVDLGPLAGRTGTLELRTDPRGDPWLALAAFAHPRVVVTGAQDDGAPSVLLVLVDTLRADTLEGDSPLAPRLREFCDGAMHFGDAVAPAPWTTPSVIATMTGLYPWSHDGEARQVLRDGAPSLVHELRDQGRVTWSLQTNPALRDAGLERGFEGQLYLHDASADVVTDRAAEWLARRAREPFFAYVHYIDPHAPYLPHPELDGWDGAPPTGVTPPDELGRPKVLEWDPDPAGQAWLRRRYEQEVRHVDHHVGRLLDAGDRDGWGARTVVVLVTDHGEEFWDHGGFEHGHGFHRELIDVVLAIRPVAAWDGDASVTARPASLVDVRPTLLGLLGAEAGSPCQGLNLLAADFPEPRTRYSVANLYGEPGRAVVQGPWRLQQLGKEPARLYDLGVDPGERRDRAASEITRGQLMQRQIDVEHRLQCDTILAGIEAASTDVPDREQLDLATRQALELLGYVER